MSLSVCLVLHNCIRKMLHFYLELQYKYKTHACLKHVGEWGCVTGKESKWIHTRPFQHLPLKFFEKKQFLFFSLMTPFSGYKSIAPLQLCPFSYFLKQSHTFPVKPKQKRGMYEPSSYSSTSRFSADSAGLFWDCQSRAAENHQTFRGIPFCHFYYSGKKKNSDDVSF